jgi:hypothetical protein
LSVSASCSLGGLHLRCSLPSLHALLILGTQSYSAPLVRWSRFDRRVDRCSVAPSPATLNVHFPAVEILLWSNDEHSHQSPDQHPAATFGGALRLVGGRPSNDDASARHRAQNDSAYNICLCWRHHSCSRRAHQRPPSLMPHKWHRYTHISNAADRRRKARMCVFASTGSVESFVGLFEFYIFC